MSLAYPGESSALSDIVGRDASLKLWMIMHCECAFWRRSRRTWTMSLIWSADWKRYGFYGTGNSEEQIKIRTCRGRRERIHRIKRKLSEEVLKQFADLKRLACSYHRDLERQQQEIEGLKRCHQPHYQGNLNPHRNHFQQERCGLGEQVFPGDRSGSA